MRFRSISLELNDGGALQVFGVSLGYQMSRSNTGGVVAEVANFEAIRYDPELKGVGQSVRQPGADGAVVAIGGPEVTVSARQAPTQPKPTFTAPIDLCPKAFLQWANDLFRAKVYQRVAMTLEAAVVHLAPTTFFGGLGTFRDGANHV